MLLIFVATAGITFSLQATFADNRVLDALLRIVLAAIALVVLFHSDRQVAWIACIPVALFAAYWFMKRRGSPVLVPADAANPRA